MIGRAFTLVAACSQAPAWEHRSPKLQLRGSRCRSEASGKCVPKQELRNEARRGFTLVELLVVITIIGILATVVLGGVNMARESARETRTKATIAKLNQVLMQKYDSYMTRRVPIDTSALSPAQAASHRLQAIRKLMAMEMPDRYSDFQGMGSGAPVSYGGGQMPPSSVAMLYALKYAAKAPTAEHQSAKCLYLLVMTGIPEARELFSAAEYADVSGDGWPVFVDGWNKPIRFLREPLAFTIEAGLSDIQSSDYVNKHDPFDPLNVDTNQTLAYQRIPLVYSAGNDRLYGLNEAAGASCGAPIAEGGKNGVHFDNIHNHRIEQR